MRLDIKRVEHVEGRRKIGWRKHKDIRPSEREELNSSFLSNIMYKSQGLCACIYCDLMWSMWKEEKKEKMKK